MFLNGQAILDARDRKSVTVPCPEWGGDVLVGSMGALDRARLADWLNGQEETSPGADDEGREKEGTVITTDSPEGRPERIEGDAPETCETCDGPAGSDPSDAGRFTRLQNTELMVRYLVGSILDPDTYQPAFSSEQIEALGQKNPKPLNRLYEAALELNADTVEARAQLEKNSGATPPDDSGGV